jgi:hypothetical protein
MVLTHIKEENKVSFKYSNDDDVRVVQQKMDFREESKSEHKYINNDHMVHGIQNTYLGNENNKIPYPVSQHSIENMTKEQHEKYIIPNPVTQTKQQSGELDMDLKIKFKKILWKMGHYGRIDVKIAGYGEQMPQGRRDGIAELTDIDVYGFNFHDDFQINNIVVDCKNGENVSPSNRLFWIKGVMESLNDSRGYLVMGKKIIPTHLRDLANKFNVSLMDGKNITALERIYNISELDGLPMFSEELFHKQERITENAIKELIEYRKYHYWIEEDHTKIHNIINLLEKYSGKLNPNNKNHQIIVMDFCILFTMALFKLCSFIMKTSLSDIKSGVLLFLYNGPYNLDKYTSILNLFDKIFKATAKNYDEIKKSLDYKPPFFSSLIDLTISMLRRPDEAKNILKYMDAALYSVIMQKKEQKKSLIEVFPTDFNEISNKLMFDIFDFIESNTNINPNLIPKKEIYM